MNLVSLKTYVPKTRIPLDTLVESRGGKSSEAKIFRQLFGFNHASSLAEDESAQTCFLQLLGQACASLIDGPKIDAVILVQGLPARSPRQHVDLDVLRASCEAISDQALLFNLNQQNCATLFWGLKLADRLLSRGEVKRVALLAGDTLADFALSERYVPGCTLIGDAFACAILDAGWGECTISDIHCCHRPEFWPGLDGTQDDIRKFYRAHDELAGMALNLYTADLREQAWLLPHNINKLAWQTWARHPANAQQRVATDLINETGHCYTTDPLLLLESYAPAKTGCPAILLSVGLGGWVGSATVTRYRCEDINHVCEF
ncbi:3-oxoacyl-ACP synthase [Dickeya sp. CFBP 2040]|nr:3-oxoacyl-ACP synthase [Dickeya sp. CFBP 2040]